MRLLATPMLLLVAVSAKVCDSDDKAKADGSAQVGAKASAQSSAADGKVAVAAPRIGGAVAAAGDLSVEVVLHRSGLIEALVSDARGKLVSEGIKLSATARAKAGATEKLELGFVPARGRFEARAKAELVPGPVDVALEVSGKTHGCKIDAAVALPEPRIGGHLLAAGAFGAEVRVSAGGELAAFVTDSAGKDLNAGSDVKLTASVSTKAGARERIALAFDAARASFVGKAQAGVELAPGPLELSIEAKLGGGTGRLEAVALSVDATHGGQLVAVGEFSVELVARGAAISAFVLDASGKAHAASDLDLSLDIGADAATRLALKWDAPSASYVGRVDGNIELGASPIRISLVAGGKAFVGAIASLTGAAKLDAKLKGKLDADAKLDGSAKLDAAAKAKLDAAAKAKLDQSAKAGASVKVTPPKVGISTNKSASAGAKVGGGKAEGKASAGFSFGTK